MARSRATSSREAGATSNTTGSPEPGGYVHESPGVIHTLVCDDPNGMKTVFWLNGSLEFYDDDDNLTQTFDVFWYIDHYLSYCKEHGLPVNQALFV